MFLEKSEGPAFSSGDFERMETTCKSYEKYLNCIVLVMSARFVLDGTYVYLFKVVLNGIRFIRSCSTVHFKFNTYLHKASSLRDP